MAVGCGTGVSWGESSTRVRPLDLGLERLHLLWLTILALEQPDRVGEELVTPPVAGRPHLALGWPKLA